MTNENSPPPDARSSRRQREDALHLGPRKRPPTRFSWSSLRANGELADEPEESFTAEQRREHRVFGTLLRMVPGLEDRLMEGTEDDLVSIAEMIQKGASSARSDDTKSLKGAVLDWIVPHGQSLNPPIARNVKMERGFFHERTGELLCPAGMDWSDEKVKADLRNCETIVPGDLWPIFLYSGYKYDLEDPWKGLFRSSVLVSAYKHVFTSPSSVDKVTKATRSGNARIHGMTSVTHPSIAYIATQVRFALSSSAVFTRTDVSTDSERFYESVLEYFEDPEERQEVNELTMWWNQQIFPAYSSARRPITKNSARAMMKEKREQRRQAGARAPSH